MMVVVWPMEVVCLGRLHFCFRRQVENCWLEPKLNQHQYPAVWVDLINRLSLLHSRASRRLLAQRPRPAPDLAFPVVWWQKSLGSASLVPHQSFLDRVPFLMCRQWNQKIEINNYNFKLIVNQIKMSVTPSVSLFANFIEIVEKYIIFSQMI